MSELNDYIESGEYKSLIDFEAAATRLVMNGRCVIPRPVADSDEEGEFWSHDNVEFELSEVLAADGVSSENAFYDSVAAFMISTFTGEGGEKVEPLIKLIAEHLRCEL